MNKVVILRPEPGASATLEGAIAAGIDAIAIPLFEVTDLPWVAPESERFDAVVLTSANAIRHGGPELAKIRHLPAHCVGEATAAAARAAGFTIGGVGSGDVTGLMLNVPPGLALLHLTGRDHQWIDGATTVHVYQSRAIDPPPPLDALSGGAAMVHSARAGARLAELVTARGDIAIAAISAAAATACGTGWRDVAAVDSPADGALLALAAALCHNR